MSSGSNQRPNFVSIVAAGTVITATGNSTAFALKLADAYTFVVNVTAASGTSPTLDIVYQTSVDGGTTYVNIPWRHTQITAAGVTFLTVRLGLGIGEVGAEGAVASTGGTLVKPFVPDTNFMRLAYTVGATTPSFTFSVTAFFLPKGSQTAW